MTPPKDDQKFVAIPQDLYEELRANDPPKWYKRHRVSLFISGGFTLVVFLLGVLLDQRTGNRLEAMDSGIQAVRTQVESTKTQVEVFSGQIKLVGDRLQAMDNRIQSMDSRLIEVQVKVGKIEGRLGERFGSTGQLPEGQTNPDTLPQTAEVPRYNQPTP